MSKTDRIPGGKIVYDYDAFQAVREMANKFTEEVARDVAEKAANYPQPAPRKSYGYSMAPVDGARVFPSSPHAANSNAKHETLAKLIGEVNL